VGLVSFTKSNSLQLLNTIEFDSYPSEIKITDFNNDGINEALVYGNNFNGLILIRNEGYRLNAEILFEQSLFNDLVLIDFNQDDLTDIVLIDILNNSLKFLENTEVGQFFLNREIEKDESLYCLEIANINNDSFSDSFSSSFLFNNDFPVDNFIFTDFNSDNYPDLAIINRVENRLEIKLSNKNENESIFYLFDGISDFESFTGSTSSSLLVLSKNGRLHLVSAENNIGKNFSYSIGGVPNKIYSMHNSNASGSSIIYNNTIDNSVNILKLDSTSNIISNNDHQFLNKISDFAYSNNFEFLVGYEYRSRLLEFLSEVTVKENINYQNYFYTDFPIEELIVDEQNKIHVLEKNVQNLHYEVLERAGQKIISSEQTVVDSFVVGASISNNSAIYYWQFQDSIYTLNLLVHGEKEKLLSVDSPDSILYNPIFVNSELRNDNISLTILGENNFQKIYLIKDKDIVEYSTDLEIDWQNGKFMIQQDLDIIPPHQYGYPHLKQPGFD